MTDFSNYIFTAAGRFLQYVTIDTQSDPQSSTCPSTGKQKDLARLLVTEFAQMGISATLDENGYVYAGIAANTSKKVPVICFCSHMDTSPDCSGAGVKPIVHRSWDGGDIVLPDDPSVILRTAEHPGLAGQVGNDIITASGLTLLGADNKAGVAEIMDAVNFLVSHPEVKHGAVSILFTPDEEIGRGVNKADLQRVGAEFAYTVDGEERGSLENETFSADGARLTIRGVSIHPGFAKGKMESAIRILAKILEALPVNRLSPESTSGREGFIHAVSVSGQVEEATADFIIRDFDDDKLKEHAQTLDDIARRVLLDYPNSSYTLEVTEQYRNMKAVLDQHPQIIDYAITAMKRVGLEPKLQSIRGGTDGSRLSFMGLPCPNIFAGEHAFHGKEEWVSVQDMELAVRTIVEICSVWEEEAM